MEGYVAVFTSVLGLVGVGFGAVATLKKDKHLNHSAIVNEYRNLLDDHTKEIGRLRDQILLGESKITRLEQQVEILTTQVRTLQQENMTLRSQLNIGSMPDYAIISPKA